MKWLETKIILENNAAINAADIISDIFSNLGLQGTVIEDPTLEPEEGWGSDAIPLPEKYAVIGYLPVNESVDKKCKALEEKLADLKTMDEIAYIVETREIDEQDWAESWKDHFWPERITDRIVIKPTWRDFDPEPDDIILEIDPGMAFGTGTHPTTSSCIKMIEQYLKPGGTMLDIGTGSGILMVAAARLGAGKTCGVDTDEVAVEIAGKNLLLNNVSLDKYTLYAGDLVDCIKDRFDVVVANILSEVIVRLLDDIHTVMADNAVLICSGIIERNKSRVVEKMAAVGLEVMDTLLKDGWVTLAARASR